MLRKRKSCKHVSIIQFPSAGIFLIYRKCTFKDALLRLYIFFLSARIFWILQNITRYINKYMYTFPSAGIHVYFPFCRECPTHTLGSRQLVFFPLKAVQVKHSQGSSSFLWSPWVLLFLLSSFFFLAQLPPLWHLSVYHFCL